MRLYKLLIFKKLLNISYGYMQRIPFLWWLSNLRIEKWRFWRIKRANSSDRIHPIKLRFKSSILEIFSTDIFSTVLVITGLLCTGSSTLLSLSCAAPVRLQPKQHTVAPASGPVCSGGCGSHRMRFFPPAQRFWRYRFGSIQPSMINSPVAIGLVHA